MSNDESDNSDQPDLDEPREAAGADDDAPAGPPEVNSADDDGQTEPSPEIPSPTGESEEGRAGIGEERPSGREEDVSTGRRSGDIGDPGGPPDGSPTATIAVRC